MAAKKTVVEMPVKKDDKSDFGMLEIYLLIIIGLMGLLSSSNIAAGFPTPSYLPFIGYVLVFVIGATKLISKTG